MIVEPFRAEHMDGIEMAGREALIGASFDPAQRRALEGDSSWTALDGDTVLAIAGVVNMWEGRYLTWALISRHAGARMRRVTKAVRVYLDALDARRVELTVEVSFKAGHQWARMLGFELETPCMRAYAPDGADHAMYVRARKPTGAANASKQ